MPPSNDKHYDIAQIKDDTTWLSSTLNVNEEQALRVVLLEWQDRPKLRLQAGYSDAEIASLKDVYASQLAFDADFEAATFQLRDDAEFAKQTSRRQRQIFIHFKECIGFAKAWLALRNQYLNERLGIDVAGPPALGAVVDLVVEEVQRFSNGLNNNEVDEETAYIAQMGRLCYIGELLESFLLAIDHTHTVPSDIVKKWYNCMADSEFLRGIEATPLMPQEELRKLECRISLTSIALLQPAKSLDQLEASWLLDIPVVSEVQQILLNAVDEECIQAVPIAFTWSMILQDVRARGITAKERRDTSTVSRSLDSSSWDSATGRRASIAGSSQQSVYEDIIEAVVAVSGLPDPISTVFQHTIDQFQVGDLIAAMLRTSQGLPFIQRLRNRTVQEVIKVALATLPEAYGPVVLQPQFAVLEPKQDIVDAETCNDFLRQPDLVEGILDNAASRFPHESYPFFKLCRMLACADGDETFNDAGDQYVTFRLKAMKSFTHLAIGQFQNYHTVHEDENANLVELDQNTYGFPREIGLLTQAKSQSSVLVIPAQTEGEVVSNTDPPVVRWRHEYSGLHLIGEWLELYYNSALHEVVSAHEDSVLVASEMISLTTNLLTTTFNSRSSNEDAVLSILEEMSTNLNFGSTIVGLVFDILEQDVQAYKRRPSNVTDVSVLHASVRFARTILKTQPTQFWRYIAKTSIATGNGLLTAVILGNESTSTDTVVTLAVSELYSDMIAAAVQRPLQPGRPTLHKNDERLYRDTMLGSTQNMLEVYDSISQWRHMGKQKQELVTSLSHSFSTIIYFTYAMGPASSRLTACLRSAAQQIMHHLRPESVSDAKSGPILNHLLDSVQLRQTFLSSDNSDTCFDSLLKLSKMLVDAARAQSLPASGLEHCLFDLTPVLARNLHLNCPLDGALAVSESYSSSKLLRALISFLSTAKPTSLLGYLGSESAIDTISILCTAPPDGEFAREAWTLLSNLIGRDQQWLSIVILTGSIPDRKGADQPSEVKNVYRGKLLVDKALTLLSHVSQVEEKLLQAVLQFMITAQQNWSWTLNALRSRTDVFTSLVQYATAQSRNSLESHNLTVALITDLCSVYLQFAKSTKDNKIANTIVPLIEWLARKAIDVKSYNTSLHTNLSRNFEGKFGVALEDFRRHARPSSDANYYDTTTIDVALFFDPAWAGSGTGGKQSQSYKSEVARANENLFRVDSELTLLESFQSLLLEHASYFAELDALKNTLAPIARRCLEANSEANTKAPVHLQLFDTLSQSRTETALSLMQQLLRVKTTGSEVRELLKVAWESSLIENASYEKAMVNDDLTHWRTSLNVVLMALQFHLGKSKSAWRPRASTVGPNQHSAASELLKHTTNIGTQVIEIGKIVIGEGLDTVVSTMLEAKQAELQRPPSARTEEEMASATVGLSDLRLILNFLTSILRHPRLPDFQAQLAQILISTGAIQSALRLYSFSHLLAGKETEHDPVHGEIALRILVSLSSLSQCAEELAIEGVLSQLLTARITIALQRMPEGVSSLDARQHCASLYLIWSQGILPLVLNLLNTVGGPIASEVSNFINSFPSQLQKLNNAFQSRQDEGYGFLTLSLAKEVSTMSLISYILEDYKNAGASAAVDASRIQALSGFDDKRAGLVSDLKEHMALEKGVLMRKIVPMTGSEETMGVKLVDQVLNELRSALTCLTKGEEEV